MSKENIHPQYLIALADYQAIQFIIETPKPTSFNFVMMCYCDDIKLLYKIKDKFKSGKIIKLADTYCLKITKQLQNVIKFFLKNRPKIAKVHSRFLRWQYLYNKLIENKQELTEKEQNKIDVRLESFYHDIV